MLRPRAVFLGGVAADSFVDRELAHACGSVLGRLGYALYHGGYNGLMEDAARGASAEGTDVIAVTLMGKEEWGQLNPYVTRAIYANDLGHRLETFLSTADVVVAMGGGVGTLHEITAAIWYAGNVRPIPVVMAGSRAEALLNALKEQKWIYSTPTRPVDFLHVVHDAEALERILGNAIKQSRERDRTQLQQAILASATVTGRYVRADGTELGRYFDPFRLSGDPALLQRAATAMCDLVAESASAVAAIALGGVPLATCVAGLLHKPLLIVRPQPKAYGTNAQVEGNACAGTEAVLVDDVVSSGSAILSARDALRSVGVRVHEAVCVLSRGSSGRELLRQHGVTLQSLFVRADDAEITNQSEGG